MGTRADFHIGRGKDAQWLGSIAWDSGSGLIVIRSGSVETPPDIILGALKQESQNSDHPAALRELLAAAAKLIEARNG